MQDLIYNAVDLVNAERDPLLRLVLAIDAHKSASELLHRAVLDTAYECREKYTLDHIEQSTGISIERVKNLSRSRFYREPESGRAKPKSAKSIDDDAIDFSRG